MIILPILISTLVGAALLVSSLSEHVRGQQGDCRALHTIVGGTLSLSAIGAVVASWTTKGSFMLLELFEKLPVCFQVDELGRLFVMVTSVVWMAICFYSFRYMKHEGEEKQFYGFFLIVYAVLIALDFSGNLITMYLFYELMTLTSMPLILHNRSKESVMAALKYLFYSMAGAYLALFGIFILYRHCHSLAFVAGGSLDPVSAVEHRTLLLVVVFLMLIGFGAKAGMFPLHAWLPTAHPAAPAPASAALSAIVVKCGVLAVVRLVYYVVGADFVRGSWVQKAWLWLTLLTVFMGSMLAYREKVFKKRLAYSTVSQVSYILFGLALFTPQGFTGAILQLVGHAFAKCALFMTAGIFILRTGKTRVEDYEGIGRQMRVTLWAYTIAALSLIGIPPTIGFVTKWYLAQGALMAQLGALSIVGPVILLISALLTAGYLLPVTMRGFYPGEGSTIQAQKEKPDMMCCMLVLMAFLAFVLGMFPGTIIEYTQSFLTALM